MSLTRIARQTCYVTAVTFFLLFSALLASACNGQLISMNGQTGATETPAGSDSIGAFIEVQVWDGSGTTNVSSISNTSTSSALLEIRLTIGGGGVWDWVSAGTTFTVTEAGLAAQADSMTSAVATLDFGAGLAAAGTDSNMSGDWDGTVTSITADVDFAGDMTCSASLVEGAATIEGAESAWSVTIDDGDCTMGGGPEAIKFNPGHYLYISTNYVEKDPMGTYSLDNALASVANYCANTDIDGFKAFFFWSALEDNTPGDYTNGFARVHTLGNAVEACGKRLMVMVAEREFGNSHDYDAAADVEYIFPTYLINATYGACCFFESGGQQQLGGAVGSPCADDDPGPDENCTAASWSGGLRLIARFDNPDVADRLVALSDAYGAEFNDEPWFEMWSPWGETAFDGDSGLNITDVMTELEALYDSAEIAWPNTAVRLNLNFVGIGGTDVATQNSMAACAARSNCVFGGPDPNLPGRPIQANQVYVGDDYEGGTTPNDFRDELGFVAAQEGLGMESSPYAGGSAPPGGCVDSVAAVRSEQEVNMQADWYAFAVGGMTCIDDFLDSIASDPGLANAACPANFASCETG